MSNLGALMGLSTSNLTSGFNKTTMCMVLFALLLLVGACEKKHDKAETVLSRDKMAAVMVDVYLAEARLNGALIPRDSMRGIFVPVEKGILEKHGVSKEQLTNSYTYYLEHPDEFEKIYDALIDTLVLREQRAKALPNKNQK